MKRVLFSCLGTSDPVRGEHDGPMMHILRHYRPERVDLILTPEIRENAEEDARFERTRDWIVAHWGGYCPEFRYHPIGVRDAHDMDALDRPLHDALAELSREEPDAELLINVTSGTPQMQIILSQMAMDTRYRARGVQVNNFEKKSGTSERTNKDDYDVALELECNEDELPDAENRCVEPRMYAIRREHLRGQLGRLLDARDFEAVAGLKDELPEDLRPLVLHLAARSRLQDAEAKRLADEVQGLPFKLYSFKDGPRGECGRVCEYSLLMKNRAQAGNCTEFLLHLEPLTLTLQKAALECRLKKKGHGLAEFIVPDGRKERFEPALLQSAYPELYAHYAQRAAAVGWDLKPSEPSTYLMDDLLSFFPDVPKAAKDLFGHYSGLKDLRNRLAHTLCAVTETEIRAECGVGAKELTQEIEAAIISCYTACDPQIFHVYEKSAEYLKNRL